MPGFRSLSPRTAPATAISVPTAQAAEIRAGRSKRRTDPYSVEDFTTALIKFDSGLTLSVEASFNLNIKKDIGNIELFGTNAGCRIDPELEIYTQLAGRFVNVSPADSTALSFNGLFEREILGFIDAVSGISPCRAPAEDGVELMRIIDAIYESAVTGKAVEIQR